MLRARPSVVTAFRRIADQPLLLLCALFVVSAFLSLSSLPLESIWRQWAAAAGTNPSATHLASLALDWLLLNEERREYSVTAAFLALEGFVLALIVWRESRASSAVAVRLAAAIGWHGRDGRPGFPRGVRRLEFAGFAPRRVRLGRPPCGHVGVGVRKSGMVLAIRGVCAAMHPRAPCQPVGGGCHRAFALVTSVTALALLASFRRGGWVAGTFVLVYIAVVALYLLAGGVGAFGRDEAMVVRLAVSAVALAVVVSAGFALWTARVTPSGTAFDAAAYVAASSRSRAATASPMSSPDWRSGLSTRCWAAAASFAYRYASYFVRAGGPFYRTDVRVPVPSSAHGVYLRHLLEPAPSASSSSSGSW